MAEVITSKQTPARSYVPKISAQTRSGEGGELESEKLSEFFCSTPGASSLASGFSRDEFVVIWSPGIISSANIRFRPSLEEEYAIQIPREARISLAQAETQLKVALEADPIEDGYSHPAEEFLQKIIQYHGQRASKWLLDLFLNERKSARFRAGVLRLLSRQKPFTEEWRISAIQSALSSPSVELRDEAIQASESWHDPVVIPLLREHHESCGWLADYVSQVIRDLTR